jgi:hypothetical protein
MCFQNFTMRIPESEFVRVVRHEAGHALGFPHEHMRKEIVILIDPQKAIAYFAETQGWDEAMVRRQVLTSLEESQIWGTPEPEVISIMAYQIPGLITFTGRPIPGGTDITAQDYDFAGKCYLRLVLRPKGGSRWPTVMPWTVQFQSSSGKETLIKFPGGEGNVRIQASDYVLGVSYPMSWRADAINAQAWILDKPIRTLADEGLLGMVTDGREV